MWNNVCLGECKMLMWSYMCLGEWKGSVLKGMCEEKNNWFDYIIVMYIKKKFCNEKIKKCSLMGDNIQLCLWK